MYRKLPNYLRMHRKRWSLTQEELAQLLGLTSQVAVSQYELHQRRPGADILIGSETIFGVPPRDLFPAVYGEVEGEVMARAKVLFARLEARTDLPAMTKLKLLAEMIRRAGGDTPLV